ncbi:CheR family methyltransferase [Desulfolutivibrio sulfoxidireducens]|uniref:CheR family methyltransferase n=1 Tax=Desulfolutivibrio sulfoxidireducens TaxID=2773299 RepID=UPI00159E51F5|nr:CheR family methyltransferase [Desulfolutivibrio sulfoxidireducens]QLA17476.1 hypothetical protein GD605_16005 [Desulfolutivibrio sulfoxidireducens]QLA21061.1 hypothetical protein GD604_15710 [Desulfolutivibrio sulfoxidireducens]
MTEKTHHAPAVPKGRHPHVARVLADIVGLDRETLGEAALGAAVAANRALAGVGDDAGHAARLLADPELLADLVERLVVSETWFFRDMEPFVFLGDQAVALRRSGTGRLRVLCVPCATGEEAYSLAVVLLHAGFTQASARVDAVDVSRVALVKAKMARFGPHSFRGGYGRFRDYFLEAGRDAAGRPILTPVPEAAAMVRFHHANALAPDFFADRPPYQAIFCRNLLIYLTGQARRRLLAALERLLAPGGLLFAGHAETTALVSEGFAPCERPRAFACRRRETPPAVADGRSGKGDGLTPSGGSPAVVSPAFPGSRASLVPAVPATNVPLSTSGRTPRPVASVPTPAAPLAPAARPGHLARARDLADAGEFAAARVACQAALAENGPSAEAYALMGVMASAQGETGPALDFLHKALYLDPDHQGALELLSLLHERRGDNGKARLLRQRLERAGRAHAERP